MVFILDGCSFHYAHICGNPGISICRRHFVTSKESSNPIFFRKRPILSHTCATCSELPSNISTMINPMLQTQNTHCHGNGIRPRLAGHGTVDAGDRRHHSCSEPAGAGSLRGQVLEEPEPVGQPTARPQELDVGPKECHDLQNRVAKVSARNKKSLTYF